MSPAPPANVNQQGIAMSDDEVAQFKALREKLSPNTRIEGQETFAKWLFALTTTVAALGTGFANAAFAKLSSGGVWAYAAAVLAAGIGLTLAVFALSVEPAIVRRQSYDDMMDASQRAVIKKKRFLRTATGCLGASLVLSASAGVITVLQRQPSEEPSGISFRFSDRKLEPVITLGRISPRTPAELRVFEKIPGKEVTFAAFRQIADEDGQISYHGPELKVAPEAAGLRLTLEYLRDGQKVSEESEIDFPAEPSPPGPSQTKPPPTVPPNPLAKPKVRKHARRCCQRTSRASYPYRRHSCECN